MHRGEDDPGQVWPPAPANQVRPVSTPPPRRLAGLISVCLSGLGLFCVILGCSGPSQEGLSGKAFTDAFEADEEVMLLLIAGGPLAVLGLLVGLSQAHTRSGKVGMALALLAGVWLCIRRNHF